METRLGMCTKFSLRSTNVRHAAEEIGLKEIDIEEAIKDSRKNSGSYIEF
jgi:hypothetical protein